MSYDEFLAERIGRCLRQRGISFIEKKMFGGVAFMVQDKMCVGVIENRLMARIDPDSTVEALRRPGCRLMDFTGRPMKGYVYIEPFAIVGEEKLDDWIGLALEFNPRAKSSRKKSAG